MLLLLFPLFCGCAYAEETPEHALQIFDAAQMEENLNETERSIGGTISTGGYDVNAALRRLWHSFAEKLKNQLREDIGFVSRLLVLVFLCAFSCSICNEERIRETVEICGACAAAALLTGGMSSLVNETSAAVYRLSDYSKAALPAVYTAAAASGGVSTAAIGYAQAAFALEAMMSLSQKAVIPLVYATLALTLADVIFPNPILAGMQKISKWAAKTCLTATTLTFTACLGISTLISSKVDAAALKTTRTLISGTLPIVGGMISDASSAVLSAASVMLSCMGAFGLISSCAICIGPFAVLTVKGMLFKSAAVIAEAVDVPKLQRLFSGISAVLNLMLGLLGANAIMLFLSLAAAMKVVTN